MAQKEMTDYNPRLDENLTALLIRWADEYHIASFVQDDPVQIPRGHSSLCDIEISGLLTAWLSFGRRTMIIDRTRKLDALMRSGGGPHAYLMSERWREDFNGGTKSYYRTISHDAVLRMFGILHNIYKEYPCLQAAVLARTEPRPINRLLALLEMPATSAQKKINMFLRWMIRQGSPVDIGCWTELSPSTLVIPLDTHVHRMALQLGITRRKSADFRTAVEITDYFLTLFPDDPCKGDFALFGYGVNEQKNATK